MKLHRYIAPMLVSITVMGCSSPQATKMATPSSLKSTSQAQVAPINVKDKGYQNEAKRLIDILVDYCNELGAASQYDYDAAREACLDATITEIEKSYRRVKKEAIKRQYLSKEDAQ